jgi:hypothetical protein
MIWWTRRRRARYGAQILAAEPGIRRILSYVDRGDFTDHKRRTLVAAQLGVMDATVVVERLAAVLLELGRQAGYTTPQVLDYFPEETRQPASGDPS